MPDQEADTIRIDGELGRTALRYADYITIGEGEAAEHCEIVSLDPLRIRRGDVIYELKTVGKEGE